jgi:hypothetical protein
VSKVDSTGAFSSKRDRAGGGARIP